MAWFGEYMAARMLKVKLEETPTPAPPPPPVNNVEDFDDFENNDLYPENDFQEVIF